MPISLGKVRRSQAVTTFGPGAILDIRAGAKGGGPVSVVAAGLDDWDALAGAKGVKNTQTVFEPRLQRLLGVRGFRLAPVEPEEVPEDQQPSKGKLGGYRFPDWLQCPQCYELKRSRLWSHDPGDAAKYCAPCSEESGQRVFVVPVRFVVACRRGHLEEFPWHIWVQHANDCLNNRPDGKLKLISTSGAGLASLFVECPVCHQRRSLEEIFKPDALGGLRCRGKRPWLPSDDASCGERLHVCQRGASNLYFPNICSSLDIPPWSDSIQQSLGSDWDRLVTFDAQKRREYIELLQLEAEVGMTVDDLLQIIALRMGELENYDPSRLRYDEYHALLNGNAGSGGKQSEFDARPEVVPDEAAQWFGAFTRVVRLREVRALKNFTRIDPPAGWDESGPSEFAPISAQAKDWLPAVEVRGEGIFIALKQETLVDWETLEVVKDRAQILHGAYKRQWQERMKRETEPPRQITARFVLLHTLAHVLIRQLALECGYSSSSLRERIYADQGERDMAGILVYTASTDADGTLGGLVREGKSARLVEVLRSSIRTARWCSSDPLCITSIASLSDETNLAACHSCVMAAETSCEEFNRFLDRAMLVGLPDCLSLGFFAGLN